jgi:hypothetical protein
MISIISLGSFSADQPLSVEFNPAPDDLQPCIEDIRHEIDRLRREEQLLRETFETQLHHFAFFLFFFQWFRKIKSYWY